MKSKFKLGDEIFFMNFDEPRKGVIEGIAFVVGNFKDTSFERKGTVEEPSITYSTGAFRSIDESKAFATKEELQNNLFSKL